MRTIPWCARLIVDSLRFWVDEMHVDGFRSTWPPSSLETPAAMSCRILPCSGNIETDPSLAGVKLIAEAWDAAGLYQVGSFIATVGRNGTAASATMCARFLPGRGGAVRKIADRMLGSPELYGHKQREAEQSVNFVTCHVRLHLNDLVLLQREAQRGERRGQPRRLR